VLLDLYSKRVSPSRAICWRRLHLDYSWRDSLAFEPGAVNAYVFWKLQIVRTGYGDSGRVASTQLGTRYLS
jgi:hypothetical protein